MTHDLLKLADECESIATYPDVDTQIYELATNGAEMLARSTIALREAHAEIERKDRQLEKSEREYLDIRTERDTAIADNASLRAEVESLKRGAIREVIDTLTDGPVVTKGLRNIAGVACVFEFPHEFSEAIVKASNELDAARSEIARLRDELSTQETLVATLQEQKYAWDELLGENKRLRSELETASQLVSAIESAMKEKP